MMMMKPPGRLWTCRCSVAGWGGPSDWEVSPTAIVSHLAAADLTLVRHAYSLAGSELAFGAVGMI